jgi:hypothetical protein
MKTLWFISPFVIMLVSCNNFVCRQAPTQITADQKVISSFFDTLNVIKFKATIDFKKAGLSGILILKKLTDSTSAGSFINEFGLKAFDFSIDPNRTKLGYTFRKLDKWYIRRTLGADLHFMFSKPRHFTTCFVNNIPAAVYNIGSYVHYVYYIPEGGVERAEMYLRRRKISGLQQIRSAGDGFRIIMEHTRGSLRYELNEIKTETP